MDTMHYFDTHCHFDFAEFDRQRESLWNACVEYNITRLLVPGVSPQQWSRALQLLSFPGLLMSVGAHPWFCDELSPLGLSSDHVVSLKGYTALERCIAIGECGLDAVIDIPMKHQQLVFEQQLALANELSLPLIIHVRKTHNETLNLLAQYRPEKGGVIHGFTGSEALAKRYWDMGFYLGIGGSITYPRANKTRQTVKAMPIESLILETDAPSMPLMGYQGQPNSPLRIIDVARCLSELRQESLESLVMQATHNSVRLFQL